MKNRDNDKVKDILDIVHDTNFEKLIMSNILYA